MGPLAEARTLAAGHTFASAPEYQRAQLQVLLAIYDRGTPPPVAPPEAPSVAPPPEVVSAHAPPKSTKGR